MKKLLLITILFNFGYANAAIYSCRDVKKPSSGYIVPLDVSQRIIPFYVDQQGKKQHGYKWDIESIVRQKDEYAIDASLTVYGVSSGAKGILKILTASTAELHLEIWDDSGYLERFAGKCKLL